MKTNNEVSAIVSMYNKSYNCGSKSMRTANGTEK